MMTISRDCHRTVPTCMHTSWLDDMLLHTESCEYQRCSALGISGSCISSFHNVSCHNTVAITGDQVFTNDFKLLDKRRDIQVTAMVIGKHNAAKQVLKDNDFNDVKRKWTVDTFSQRPRITSALLYFNGIYRIRSFATTVHLDGCNAIYGSRIRTTLARDSNL